MFARLVISFEHYFGGTVEPLGGGGAWLEGVVAGLCVLEVRLGFCFLLFQDEDRLLMLLPLCCWASSTPWWFNPKWQSRVTSPPLSGFCQVSDQNDEQSG